MTPSEPDRAPGSEAPGSEAPDSAAPDTSAPGVEADELDDEGLSWGDERDASHVEGPAPVTAAGSDDEIDPDAPEMLSGASLVGHGVFGGVALLSSVGWIVSRDRFLLAFGGTLVDDVQTALWLVGLFLALVAPLLWFVATILLVPQSRSGRRLVVMAVGAVALAPWPLVIGVGA
ncbi:hypothetical protein EDF38_0984 [Frigoribacterium sp. PhB160]|uniref:hypothetical protein n=1 Tax=Frigoribacterium sp. PhB160 TaxID=2485192 RepID=UPI000F4AAA81|nr:hypothetical protein [Frigoribacterium sp. PhB160]ROS61885.1 hypothetical protein EDF38_0984 [Frigoribacterium sp. PhB160]